MIKPKELRIGNYVNAFNKDANVVVDTVEEIQRTADGEFITTDNGWVIVEPIPLTEEWLLKFGFTSQNNNSNWYQLNNADNINDESDYLNEIEFCVSVYQSSYIINQFNTGQMNHLVGKIKYVHELQNLYSTLTGDDLTIKE